MDTHLHDLLDGPPLLADDPPDQVVVSQNFERNLGRFARVPGLLLHHLQDPAAGGAAVLRLPVHGDGLLQAGRVLHLAVAAIISLTLTLSTEKLMRTGDCPHLCTSTLALLCCVMLRMVAPPRPMMAPTMSLDTSTRSGKSTPRARGRAPLPPSPGLSLPPPATLPGQGACVDIPLTQNRYKIDIIRLEFIH